MKSLTVFLHIVLNEMGTRCRTSTIRDCKTVSERVEHEGLSFLTITLPTFGKDFEKSLDLGFVDRNVFHGFSWKEGLPKFLRGFLGLVFDAKSGRLLEVPDVDAIQAVRQICLLYSKVLIECSDERKTGALVRYLECESDVRTADLSFESQKETFERISRLLWADILSEVDSRVYYSDVFPKHGPGATADKLRGNAKWNQQMWTQRLEQVFPHMEFLATSWSLSLDRLVDVRIREPGEEIPVKVILVPKTLKTPRVIAIEPTCMQYMQQAVLGAIVEAVEANDTASQLIGFQSQEPNQLLAQKGSSNGALATLDLSEASDRVSNQHVRSLLRHHPHLFAAVDATRSRKADVPGHGVIRLAKFASMGSALCFPFEAMVFTTVVFMGIERELKRRLTKGDIQSFLGRVRVYGDDIIVPTDFVHSSVSSLEAFGFRVNTGKSFWTGKYRESCGKEYYDGTDVSIVRVRRVFPARRTDVHEIVSLVSLRNQFYNIGFWGICGRLDEEIRRFIPFPIVQPQSRLLGRHSSLSYQGERVDRDLQKPLVKGAWITARRPVSRLDDYGALLKCLLELRMKRSGEPAVDSDHLERSGRPLAVGIKLGWSTPY